MTNPKYENVGTPETCLIEECSELIKAICKADRFGLFAFHCMTGISNYDAIIEEIADVKKRIEQYEKYLTHLKFATET